MTEVALIQIADCIKKETEKERNRKRKYRDSNAGDNKNSKVDEGTKSRRAHNKDVGEKIQKLTVKVKVLVNS